MTLTSDINRANQRFEKFSGVYLLQVGSACYVGSSNDVHRRMKKQKTYLLRGTHHNKTLQSEFACTPDVCTYVLEKTAKDKGALITAENKWYLELKKSGHKVVNGYAPADLIPSFDERIRPDKKEEWKAKISKTLSNGMVAGDKNPFYGKKLSAESLEKARISHRKHVVRDDTKEIMRQIHKGRKIDPDVIEKRQASRTAGGKPYSTKCDFVAVDGRGVERGRFASIREFVDAGYCKGAVYKNMRNKTPYRDLYWHKEV